jgi:ADP-ribose pyrophosphatase
MHAPNEASDAATPPDPAPFPRFHVAASRRIYQSRWCGLRADDVVFPDGTPGVHHVVEISDAVVIVPVLRDGRMVLIGQYRYPHGGTHWEVPAGRLHDGEDPRAGAERELREETGCIAGRILALPGFYAINGISDHYANVFAALDCELAHATEHEPSERIVVGQFTRDETRALLRAGRIVDAFSALSLHYYFDLVDRSI